MLQPDSGRKTRYENQDTEVYGGGAVLVDLNQPIPRPDPIWLTAFLVTHDVRCEYPACDTGAITYIVLGKHAPFVCQPHAVILSGGRGIKEKRVARQFIMAAMLEEIILIAFGKAHNPARRLQEQIDRPLRLPMSLKPVSTVTFNRPKLGQTPP